MKIDPETGLPTDDNGNILDAHDAGSDMLDAPDEIDMGSSESIAAGFIPRIIGGYASMPATPEEMPDDVEFNTTDSDWDGAKAAPQLGTMEDDYSVGSSAPPQGPVITPGGAPAPGAAPTAAPGVSTPTQSSGQSTSTGTSTSRAYGYNGPTEAGKVYAKGLFGEAQKRADDYEASELAKLEASVAAQREGAKAQKQNLYDEAVVIAKHQDEMFKIRSAQATAMDNFYKLSEMARVQSKQDADAHMAAYQQESQLYRQMVLTSGNPYVAMQGSAKGKAGLAAAALGTAIQGFLGARYGINVNVAGQVDNIVNRSIEEHQAQINNQGQAVQQQQSLWQMARATAADDAEGIMRARGFVLDSMKAQLYMEAARYGSDAAMFDAKQKAGQLDAAIAANQMAMRDKIEKMVMERRQLEIDGAYKQHQASTAWATYKSEDALRKAQATNERAQAKEHEKKAEPTPQADPVVNEVGHPGLPVFDEKTGDQTGEQVGWELQRGSLTDGEIKGSTDKAQAAKEGYAKAIASGAKLTALRNRYKNKMGSSWFTKNLNPNSHEAELARAYEQEATALIRDARHDIAGAQLTGLERPEWEGYKGLESFMQRGSNAAGPKIFEDQLADSFVATMNSIPGYKAIQPSEKRVRPVTMTTGASGARRQAALGDESQPDTASRAVAQTVDPSRNDVNRESLTNATGQTVQSAGGYSPLFGEYMHATGDKRGIETSGGYEPVRGQKQKFDMVDKLYGFYLKPETMPDAPDTKKLPAAAKRAAVKEMLHAFSTGQLPDGSKVDPDVVEYVRFGNAKIVDDPWAATDDGTNTQRLYDSVTQRSHDTGEENFALFNMRIPGQ